MNLNTDTVKNICIYCIQYIKYTNVQFKLYGIFQITTAK